MEIEHRDGLEEKQREVITMLRKRMEKSEKDWDKKKEELLEEIRSKNLENNTLRRKLRMKSQSLDLDAVAQYNPTNTI